MRKFPLMMMALVFALATQSVQASLPTHDSQGKELPSLAPMLKEVTPAVVNIATFTKRQAYNPLLNDPFFRRFFRIPDQQMEQPQKRKQSAGSGVIVDAEEGYVVTNYHVIKGADEVRVSLKDGRYFDAKILGSDPELDVAVLQIDGEDLTELKLADSNKLQVGDFVVAIGNPFALGQTVTTGVVSALGRSGLGIEGYENFIQTDASINPGNSGGALVNLRGELVGINTAIIAPAGGNVGIGFAIPVNMVKNSMQQIIEHGEVKRGVIGVNIQDLTPDLQEGLGLKNGQQGVVITNVIEDSPADKAGLKVDDVIIAVNGQPTNSAGQLQSQIASHAIGETVKITVIRDGKKKTFKVKIGERDAAYAIDGTLHPLLEGATFENQEDGQGVVVSNLAPNSPAAYSGLRVGDLIVAANRMRVENLEDFAKALKRDDDKILLRVVRGRAAFYLVIRP